MRVSSNVNIAEPKEPFVFWKTFILQLLTVFVRHDFQRLITAVRLTKFWLFVLHTRGRRAAAPRPRPFPSGRWWNCRGPPSAGRCCSWLSCSPGPLGSTPSLLLKLQTAPLETGMKTKAQHQCESVEPVCSLGGGDASPLHTASVLPPMYWESHLCPVFSLHSSYGRLVLKNAKSKPCNKTSALVPHSCITPVSVPSLLISKPSWSGNGDPFLLLVWPHTHTHSHTPPPAAAAVSFEPQQYQINQTGGVMEDSVVLNSLSPGWEGELCVCCYWNGVCLVCVCVYVLSGWLTWLHIGLQ